MRSELDLNKGDRFAVLSLNSHQYIELYHAGFLGGTMINPLNLRLAPMELEYILKDSGTEVVFVDPPFAHVVDRVREAAGIKKVVLMGSGDVAHDLTHEDVIGAGQRSVPDEPEEDDPAILMYTGGTTGLPKGVVMDNRAAMLNLYKVAGMIKIDDSQVYLHQIPMFHVAGLLRHVLHPGHRRDRRRSSRCSTRAPSSTCVERDKVTLTVMVPTMIQMVLDHPVVRARSAGVAADAGVRGLADVDRAAGAGAGHLAGHQGHPGVRHDGELRHAHHAHARGPPAGRRVAAFGRAAGDQLRRVHPGPRRQHRCRAGESGEVCARAGNYMREYWHRPEQTEAAFAGGWYHTGDAGYLDEHGYLFLVDRVKDMIVTGGENVYSAEVENAIASYSGVAQVAVIGIPSEKWGEAVHAIVVMAPAPTATRGDDQGVVPGPHRRLQGAQVGRSSVPTRCPVGRPEGPQARAARLRSGKEPDAPSANRARAVPAGSRIQFCPPVGSVAVAVEPAARLAAEEAGIDHPRQQRRRGVQRLLELLVERDGDRHRGVEADQVGEGEGPIGMGAPLDHAGVDVGGGGEARLQHADGRQQVRDQQGVDDEPGPVLGADDVLARAARTAKDSAASATEGSVSSDVTTSTKWSTGNGIEEVDPDYLRRAAGGHGQLHDGDGAGVRCQDGVRILDDLDRVD